MATSILDKRVREREREIPIEYSPMHCIQSDAVVVAVSVCGSDNCDL